MKDASGKPDASIFIKKQPLSKARNYKPETAERRNIRLHKVEIMEMIPGKKREVFHTLHSFFHRQNVENPLQNRCLQGVFAFASKILRDLVKNLSVDRTPIFTQKPGKTNVR